MLEIKFTYDKEFVDLLKSLDERMLDIEGISFEKLDLNKYAREFFEGSDNVADVSIDPNANVSYKDIVVFRKEITKPFFKLNFFYNIWKKAKELYGTNTANKMVKCHIDGDIYINDATECLPYCFNFSAYDIALNGLPFVNKIKSLPPKHLKSFKNQLINFLAVASNHILGATGIADFLIVSSIYVDKILRTKQDSNVYFKSEDDIWRYVKEELVSFIYTINQPLRISEAPFVNVSVFDSIFLDKLCNDYKIPEVGEAKKDIVKKVQQIFLEAMNEELERTPITFPVITACFSKDKYNNIKDKEFLDFISKQNLKYGFINIYIGETHTLSSCCRLRSSIKGEYQNSFGAGSVKIGSIGVVTVNLPRLAYLSKKQCNYSNCIEEVVVLFKHKLEDYVKLAAKINNTRRMVIKRRIELNTMPLYTYGYIDLKKQYSTVGIVGLSEALEMLGLNIKTDEGLAVAKDIMSTLNILLDKLDKEYNYWHNIEQVPAETSAVTLAKKDRILYELNYKVYSNQFIPLWYNVDLFDRINTQGELDSLFSGGAILHLNINEQIDKPEIMKWLIITCAKKGVIYFAINYILGLCKNGHFVQIPKDSITCSVCGAEIVDTFTRVVGFLVNTKNFNKVRKEVDYPNRVFYNN